MSSVTARINEIHQPHGGYVRIKDFQCAQTDDGYTLGEENIHPTLVGLAVDYLTRFMLGNDVYNAFDVSLLGAASVGQRKNAERLLSYIRGLDDRSVFCACQVCGYDVCARNSPSYFKPVEQICPDIQTIQNIQIMVQRTLSFFEQNGPVIRMGFTFEGGYTQIVDSGDGDYLTANTLWDLKVSTKEPTSKHSLQLLMYYLLGINSIHDEFQKIDYIGIYNPRMNKVYTLEIGMIPEAIMNEVAVDVIGYTHIKDQDGLSVFVDAQHEADDMLPELLNVDAVCAWLKVKRKCVYTMLCEGELVAGKNQYQYGIWKDSVMAYCIRKEVEKSRKRKRWIKACVLAVLLGAVAVYRLFQALEMIG